MHWMIASVILLLLTILPSKYVLKWVYILIKTLPRDIRILINILQVFRWTKKCKEKDYTISKIFSNFVKKHPNKVAYYFEDEAWTFEKVEKFSNKIANYFEQEGFKKGDTIALLLENCIAYPSIWLGLSKNGIVTALINTNLANDSLLHSIESARCKAVIFGTSHVKTIQDVLGQLQSKKLYQFRGNFTEDREMLMGVVDLSQELDGVSGKIDRPKNLSINDQLLYIFTSGTTGLPKAAPITHLKFITAVKFFNEMGGITENDVIYTPLPLYHSAGGIGGAGQPMSIGATVVLRKKFSATNYFKDCVKYNVTVAQYIGEQCRYLLAVPENQCDKYQVKTFIGNGLKPQIWKQLVKRFNIQRIIELYGATEGNIYLANTESAIGAVGFIPRYLKWALGTTTIKCNEATGVPIRNKDGFCIECDIGEPGIIVAKIKTSSVINYDGYTDKQASDKKLIQNVFRNGDVYFNSGDILECDEFGYYYFKDRTGDTFRWKGENVSTSEIEAIISNILYLSDVTVYGVKIPHSEGRAGMAAIVDKDKMLKIDEIGQYFKRHLPSYAIPIFLRIMNSVPLTGTYKLKKTDLRDEGFEIDKIQDNLYFYQSNFAKYVPFTKELYNETENGKLRI